MVNFMLHVFTTIVFKAYKEYHVYSTHIFAYTQGIL